MVSNGEGGGDETRPAGSMAQRDGFPTLAYSTVPAAPPTPSLLVRVHAFCLLAVAAFVIGVVAASATKGGVPGDVLRVIVRSSCCSGVFLLPAIGFSLAGVLGARPMAAVVGAVFEIVACTVALVSVIGDMQEQGPRFRPPPLTPGAGYWLAGAAAIAVLTWLVIGAVWTLRWALAAHAARPRIILQVDRPGDQVEGV
jgi:hypothetical protein